jgi:inner membrane protein
MEPVTHIFAGTCLARAGLNRRAAYATLTMAVAAEFPDVDTMWGLRGPVEGFVHHRGMTHTLLGLPFEAAFLVAAVYGLHRWRVARAAGGPVSSKPLTAAPVRWGVLYWLALAALASHLLLDFTNNYGVRPFFPFNPRWYAGSIVFIFDPLIFGLLLGGLTVPWIFGLVGAEVGARKQAFPGRGLAMAALLGVVGVWTLRGVEHGRAVEIAMGQGIAEPSAAPAPSDGGVPAPAEATPAYLAAQRVLANPDPLNPFHWSEVTDFGAVYQRGEIDTRRGTVESGGALDPKPDRSAAVLAAEASPLGRAYIDWSPMPFVDVGRAEEGGGAVVTFRDPRFMGEMPLLGERGRSALTATVILDLAGRVVGQAMGGRVER